MMDFFQGNANLQLANCPPIEHHFQVTLIGVIDLFDWVNYFLQQQTLYLVLHSDGCVPVPPQDVDGHDRGCDVLVVVYDLVHPWHTLCDVHAGNSREMEGFQGHLRGRLPDALSCQGAYRLSRLDDHLVQPLDVEFKK